MRLTITCLAFLFLPAGSSYARKKSSEEDEQPSPKGKRACAVDAGGRPIRTLEVGSTLFVGTRGLRDRGRVDGFRVRFGRPRRSVAARRPPRRRCAPRRRRIGHGPPRPAGGYG